MFVLNYCLRGYTPARVMTVRYQPGRQQAETHGDD